MTDETQTAPPVLAHSVSAPDGVPEGLPADVAGAGLVERHDQNLPVPQAPAVEPGRLADASTVVDIVAALRDSGLVKVAHRAAELSKLHEDDPDEPQMNAASLRGLAETLRRHPRLRGPRLSLTEEGFVHAWWRTTQGGTIAMTFRPDGPVEFGAISEPAGRGDELLRIGGLHHPEVAVDALRWFTTRLATP